MISCEGCLAYEFAEYAPECSKASVCPQIRAMIDMHMMPLRLVLPLHTIDAVLTI